VKIGMPKIKRNDEAAEIRGAAAAEMASGIGKKPENIGIESVTLSVSERRNHGMAHRIGAGA
jgi:hypothetical protein